MLYKLLTIFCVLSILFSILVISSKNPVHSILFLILVFCCVAFIFIMLNIEFLAVTLLIVYVGAISVLFLFVVMMLNIKIIELEESFWKYLPIGFLVGFLFVYQIISILFDSNTFFASFYNYIVPAVAVVDFNGEICYYTKESYEFNTLLDETNTEIVGEIIYLFSFPLFFSVSIVLIVAMIGAISLVLNQNINIRRQKIFRQTLRELKECIKNKK